MKGAASFSRSAANPRDHQHKSALAGGTQTGPCAIDPPPSRPYTAGLEHDLQFACDHGSGQMTA